MTLTEAIAASGAMARSLAHLDRFRRNGTYDHSAAMRLLSGDVRSVARRAGLTVDRTECERAAREALEKRYAISV